MSDITKQLLIALLLMGTGLISPSNGIDDKVDHGVLDMLLVTAISIISVAVMFLIFKWFISQYKITISKIK